MTNIIQANSLPRRIRFKYAAASAHKILRELGNPRPPIDAMSIAKHLEYRVKYGELDGLDGSTVKVPFRGRLIPLICIGTDVGEGYHEQTVERMQNWTLGHEIGHVKLHFDHDWDSLPDHISSNFEVEAHWFASYLLMPDYVFERPEDFVPELLMEKCNVNYTPAIKRISKVDHRIAKRILGDLPTSIRMIQVAYDFASSMNEVAAATDEQLCCLICGYTSHFGHIPDFCPICGGRNTLTPKKDDKAMIYDGFDLDENGMPRHFCPRCENEQLGGEYCKACGVELINKCTNIDYDINGDVMWSCDTVADGNARFCITCGHKTTYFQNKLLRPWQDILKERNRQEQELVEADDPFAELLR